MLTQKYHYTNIICLLYHINFLSFFIEGTAHLEAKLGVKKQPFTENKQGKINRQENIYFYLIDYNLTTVEVVSHVHPKNSLISL